MSAHSLTCPYCGSEIRNPPANGKLSPCCQQPVYRRKSSHTGKAMLLTEQGYERMKRAAQLQENTKYFSERLVQLGSEFRKAQNACTHYGQLGSELEKLVMCLLNEHLPLKYKADTGFVRTLDQPGWQSCQIDILFVRQDICFPLAMLKSFRVYPIESVVGFMEVTSKVTRGKLTEDFEKVVELKRLSKRVVHMPRQPQGVISRHVDAPQPRFYYFAFSSDGTKTGTMRRIIEEICSDYDIQLHAMFVLNEGCYTSRTPTTEDRSRTVTFWGSMPASFIRFLYHILLNLQTADYLPPNASIPFEEYFDENFRLPSAPSG